MLETSEDLLILYLCICLCPKSLRQHFTNLNKENIRSIVSSKALLGLEKEVPLSNKFGKH